MSEREHRLDSNKVGVLMVRRCDACDGLGTTRELSGLACKRCMGRGRLEMAVTTDEFVDWVSARLTREAT